MKGGKRIIQSTIMHYNNGNHYMKGHDNTQDFPILKSHQPLKEENKMEKVGELCVLDSERK